MVFDQIAELGHEFHGVVVLDQLRELGLSERQTGRLVRSGFLRRTARGVFVVTGSRPTWRQRVCCELASAGPQGLASHRSATALWQLDRFRPGAIDVVSTRWSRRGAHAARVHETLDLPGRDRDRVDRIPVTSVARTIIDMGRFVGAHRLGSLLDDAVRRDLTTYEQVHERFRELARSGRNGIATVREMLEDRPCGAPVPGSDFETMVRRLLLTAGLMEPVLQHPVVCDEYRFLLDLAWPDRMVAVECEGFAFHRTPGQLEWDEMRRNRLQLRGWTVLAYARPRVRNHAAEVVAEVRRALA